MLDRAKDILRSTVASVESSPIPVPSSDDLDMAIGAIPDDVLRDATQDKYKVAESLMTIADVLVDTDDSHTTTKAMDAAVGSIKPYLGISHDDYPTTSIESRVIWLRDRAGELYDDITATLESL